MTAALIYTTIISTLMAGMVIAHILSIKMTETYPQLIPDNGVRWRIQFAEGSMALLCIALTVMMVAGFSWRAAWCINEPVKAFVVHGSVIAFGALYLGAQSWRLIRTYADARR